MKIKLTIVLIFFAFVGIVVYFSTMHYMDAITFSTDEKKIQTYQVDFYRAKFTISRKRTYENGQIILTNKAIYLGQKIVFSQEYQHQMTLFFDENDPKISSSGRNGSIYEEAIDLSAVRMVVYKGLKVLELPVKNSHSSLKRVLVEGKEVENILAQIQQITQ